MSELAQSLPWQRDESELVDELQAGSEAAFDSLVTHYHASVFNLVYGILSDRADAADVTQEVFLHAFRGIQGFHRRSSLKTWLYRISVRQALNHRRWCWRHHRQQISIDVEQSEGGPKLEIQDGVATPFEQCAAHEIQATVRRALSAVPAVFRSAVILRDLEGLSYDETAEVLEVSVGTVKSRILRGRRLLKDILDPLLRAKQVPEGRRSFTLADRLAVPVHPAPGRQPNLAAVETSLAAPMAARHNMIDDSTRIFPVFRGVGR